MRSASPAPGPQQLPRANLLSEDERFSAYSRLLAEAERQTRAKAAGA
jgi:hypothetical protein